MPSPIASEERPPGHEAPRIRGLLRAKYSNLKTESSNGNPISETVPWTVAELKQLGRTPDSVLARRTQRTIQEIVAMRESRGIGLTTGPRRWTEREIRLLGTLSDHEVGRRLRRPAWAVCSQRTALKIPPFKPRPKWRAWKPSELILLRRLPTAEAARRLKRSLRSVSRQRWRLGMAT